MFGHSMEDSYPYVSGDTMDTGDCLYDVTNTVPVVGITGYDTIYNDQVQSNLYWWYTDAV